MFFNDAYDVSVKATNQVGYCRAIIGQMTIGFKPSQPSGSTEGPVNLSSSLIGELKKKLAEEVCILI